MASALDIAIKKYLLPSVVHNFRRSLHSMSITHWVYLQHKAAFFFFNGEYGDAFSSLFSCSYIFHWACLSQWVYLKLKCVASIFLYGRNWIFSERRLQTSGVQTFSAFGLTLSLQRFEGNTEERWVSSLAFLKQFHLSSNFAISRTLASFISGSLLLLVLVLSRLMISKTWFSY